MRNFRCLPALLLLLCSCSETPRVNSAADTATERASPTTYVKVNYEVRKNLTGRRVVEGDVINTGRFQSYTSVSLSIELTDGGHKTVTEYTVAGKLPPGGRNHFRYRPEGSPEHVAIKVGAVTAE